MSSHLWQGGYNFVNLTFHVLFFVFLGSSFVILSALKSTCFWDPVSNLKFDGISVTPF
jgi:hypothetical protein